MKRPLTLSAVALVAGLALTACGGGDTGQANGQGAQDAPTTANAQPSTSASTPSTSEASPTEAPQAETVIVIKDFEYTTPQSVPAGATITVRNEDDVAHTVTADSGEPFDVNVPPSSEVTFTAPQEAGSYDFYCTYHPNMTSTLTVA